MEQNKSLLESKSVVLLFQPGKTSSESNDHNIGLQNWNLINHPNGNSNTTHKQGPVVKYLTTRWVTSLISLSKIIAGDWEEDRD